MESPGLFKVGIPDLSKVGLPCLSKVSHSRFEQRWNSIFTERWNCVPGLHKVGIALHVSVKLELYVDETAKTNPLVLP